MSFEITTSSFPINNFPNNVSEFNNNNNNNNKKLVDEIEDGFLLCPLCLNPFRRPKVLSCLHTYCARCLEESYEEEIGKRKYYDPREITCPICKKKTSLLVGGVRSLPDNHLVLSLSEVVHKQKKEMKKQEEEPMCEVCRPEDEESLEDDVGFKGDKELFENSNGQSYSRKIEQIEENDTANVINGLKSNCDNISRINPNNSTDNTPASNETLIGDEIRAKTDAATISNITPTAETNPEDNTNPKTTKHTNTSATNTSHTDSVDNNAGKRRKSFMSAGMVLRSSVYDENIKQHFMSFDEGVKEKTGISDQNSTMSIFKNGNSTQNSNRIALNNTGAGGSNSGHSNSSSSGVGSSTVSNSNESSLRNTQISDEKDIEFHKSSLNNNTDNDINNNSKTKNYNNNIIKDRRAISKCLECNKMLCRSCVERHQGMKVTGCHCLIDVETEKDVQCKEHPGEAVRFFCEPCMECVCVLCAFNKHRTHNVETFADSADRQRDTLLNVITGCKEKSEKLQETINRMSKLEDNFKKVEGQVREKATEAVMKVRAQERDLINDIHEKLGASFIKYLENKDHLDLQLETMQNTCSLADLVVASKDVEMLLLKKEVEEKLSILSRAEFDLEPVLTPSFVFNPGSVELGRINNEDCDIRLED